jgi:hypothetical protein
VTCTRKKRPLFISIPQPESIEISVAPGAQPSGTLAFSAKRKGGGIEKTESSLRSFNPNQLQTGQFHSLAESFPHGEKPSQCRADHNR